MIIGLCGFKGSGKTVVANHLITEYGFVAHNFKSALNKEVKQNFPELLDVLANAYHMDIDKLFVNKPVGMRALLQNYGTDVRRAEDPGYWVKEWCKDLHDENYVVDDVRFLNEARAIRDRHGIIIRVTRPDITTGGSHLSETEHLQIEADFTVAAPPGEHAYLRGQVDGVIETLKRNVD